MVTFVKKKNDLEFSLFYVLFQHWKHRNNINQSQTIHSVVVANTQRIKTKNPTMRPKQWKKASSCQYIDIWRIRSVKKIDNRYRWEGIYHVSMQRFSWCISSMSEFRFTLQNDSSKKVMKRLVVIQWIILRLKSKLEYFMISVDSMRNHLHDRLKQLLKL